MNLMPNEGGCWFCHKDGEDEPLDFNCEYDTFVHVSCIKKALEGRLDHPEAIHMEYMIPVALR